MATKEPAKKKAAAKAAAEEVVTTTAEEATVQATSATKEKNPSKKKTSASKGNSSKAEKAKKAETKAPKKELPPRKPPYNKPVFRELTPNMNAITNVLMIRDGRITPTDLILDGDTIIDIMPKGKAESNIPNYNGHGLYLSHGFVDLHARASSHKRFENCTEDVWRAIAEEHLKHGTTEVLPGLIPFSKEDIKTSQALLETCQKDTAGGARLLGLDIEGPYFSSAQLGSSLASLCKDPDPKDYLEILNECPGILRWSLAPELPGALELARELKRRKIMPCISYSNATYDEVKKSLSAGFRHISSLYCGCSTITNNHGHYHGGVVESAYVLTSLTAELLPDGSHLPPELLRMAYRFIGPQRLALVSGALEIEENDSAPLGCELIRRMIDIAGASIIDAVTMMTETPARILGKSRETGFIQVGRKADLVLFDENINIKRVWVDGKVRYEA